MRISYKNVLPTIALLLLIILRVKEYNVWDQILSGYISGSTLNYLENFTSHTVRLVLMHPILSTAELFDLERNIVFSLFVLGIFVYINFRVCSWCNFFFKRKRGQAAFVINTALLLFFLLINGRNAFSFLANVLLFDAYIIIYRKNKFMLPMLLAFLAGFFCNVSSGTYAVMAINVGLCFFINVCKRPFSKYSFRTLLILIGSVGLYIPVLVEGMAKNLEFYDYSLTSMLSHGYGKIISGDVGLMIIVIPIGVILGLVSVYHILITPLSNMVHLRWTYLLSSGLGGLFGYSALVGALPVLLFLTLLTYKTTIKFW